MLKNKNVIHPIFLIIVVVVFLSIYYLQNSGACISMLLISDVYPRDTLRKFLKVQKENYGINVKVEYISKDDFESFNDKIMNILSNDNCKYDAIMLFNEIDILPQSKIIIGKLTPFLQSIEGGQKIKALSLIYGLAIPITSKQKEQSILLINNIVKEHDNLLLELWQLKLKNKRNGKEVDYF